MRHLPLLLGVLLLTAAVAPPVSLPGAYRPPENYVLWSNGPGYRATLLPEQFAREAVAMVECESSGDVDAIGDQGRAFGRLQIRLDVHRVNMVELGLDPMQEADRILFAARLWREQGWEPWHNCAAMLGLLK